MPFKKTIRRLQGGSVLAECGPMRLVITASIGKVLQPDLAERGGEEAFKYLERLASLRPYLSKTYRALPGEIDDPLALQMIRSVLVIGDEGLTPMAAVAGTISDAVADFLLDRGMTRVMVNNGGDIAVRLQEGEHARVGVRADARNNEGTGVLVLDSRRSHWGIATSGMGGRSLTRGIASTATVVADSASLADAGATAVANASFVRDGHVLQRLAREIDPDTDIPDVPVTVKVGSLSREKRLQAITCAMSHADPLFRKGIIHGLYIAVGEDTFMTDFFKERMIL